MMCRYDHRRQKGKEKKGEKEKDVEKGLAVSAGVGIADHTGSLCK